jgi:hypothetical protein
VKISELRPEKFFCLLKGFNAPLDEKSRSPRTNIQAVRKMFYLPIIQFGMRTPPILHFLSNLSNKKEKKK